jgi:purine-binding chemotaxis protein CheW
MSVNQLLDSYLTFKLSDELFAINVAKVLEILQVKPITRVPKSPEFMRGVINLRGSVLPVIDTRYKFGMSTADFTIDTCIVVVSINTGTGTLLIGALVDAVQEVIEIPDVAIQPSPVLKAPYSQDFIKGIGRLDDNFIIILDIDKVFSVEEFTAIATD